MSNNKMNNKSNKSIGLTTEALREGYEGTVVKRMAGRAGASSPKGAAGNAFEIMATDKNNLKNALKKNTVTKLTKNSTATQVDAVTLKNGKVTERIQYKDTVSKSGVRKTIKQVESGKYQQAQLQGTIEATKKYNEAAKASGVKKTMKSTGISHNTAQRVGDKCTKQPLKASSLCDAVKISTGLAVGLTAVSEVGKSIANNDSVGECTGHVVSKGAETAISVAAATTAGEVTISAVGGLLASSAIPIAGPVIAGIGAAAIVGSAVGDIAEGVFDEVGDFIGDVVDDVLYGISDFVEGLFWWL